MTEMFGEAWSPMSVPDLAPDDDIYIYNIRKIFWPKLLKLTRSRFLSWYQLDKTDSRL